MNRRAVQRIVAIGVVSAVALVGCSDDSDEASTCEDLQSLSTEVRGLRDVNVVESGISGLQEQTDAIDDAFEQAKKSGDEQFGSQLDALDASIETLKATVTTGREDGASIRDLATQAMTDIEAVSTSFDELRTAVSTELDDCDLSASSS